MQINKIMFGGNLTAEPELKAIPSGMKVINFTLATNRTWKDANGTKQEQVEYGNCIMFGKSAEAFATYAVKGQNFLVEGRIQTKNWDDKDSGKKMYRTEIVVDQFHFGAKPQNSDGTQTRRYAKEEGEASPNEMSSFDDLIQNTNTGSGKPRVAKPELVIDYGEAIDPNDIPF